MRVILIAAMGGLSLSELRVPATESLGRIGVLVMRLRTNGIRLITADLRSEVTATIAKREGQLRTQFARYEALPLTPPERATYAAVRRALTAYAGLRQQAMARAGAGDMAGAQHIYDTTMSAGINAVLPSGTG